MTIPLSRVRRLYLLLPFLLLAASCLEPTELPIGGVYRATLQAQGGESGAVIELVGPGIQEVSAPSSVLATHVAGDTVRILILADPRNIAAPPPLSFNVTMADGVGVPRASVKQVVDFNNLVRNFPDTYVVNFSRE